MTSADKFFQQLFGDPEPSHFGTGWMSGVASAFFGMLGLGGALCLHYPALLTLPDARAHYPMPVIRLLIQAAILLAFLSGTVSALLRRRKVLALTGLTLGLAAALLGGGSTPLPQEVTSTRGIGLD